MQMKHLFETILIESVASTFKVLLLLVLGYFAISITKQLAFKVPPQRVAVATDGVLRAAYAPSFLLYIHMKTL